MSFLKESSPSTAFRPDAQRKFIHGKQLMTVVIDFVNGPWTEPDPPHHHVHEQITYIAKGKIRLFCDGEPDVELQAGDMFYIPSNRKHTIQLLSETARLVDTFTPLREDML